MTDKIHFRNKNISREDVIRELQKFDLEYPDPNQFKNWIEGESYKYILRFNGRPYPPKSILSRMTSIDVSKFSGGDETNRVFRELGFELEKKESADTLTNLIISSDLPNNRKLLNIKKQIILYGPPGTGKTYNTKRYLVSLLEEIDETDEPFDVIPESVEVIPMAIEEGGLFGQIKIFIMNLPNVTEKIRSSMSGYYSVSRMNKKKMGLTWVSYPALDKSLRVWLRKEIFGKYSDEIKSMPGYKQNGWGGYPEFRVTNDNDVEKAKIFINHAYENL